MRACVASLTWCALGLVACSKDFDRLQGGVAAFDGSAADARVTDADGIDAMDASDAAIEDTSTEDVAPAPDAGDAGCVLRRPPDRPAIADGPSVPVRWYAMRTIALGIGETWRGIGYDLDGRCTSTESGPDEVECAPAPGFTPADDAEGGMDNTFGQTLVPLLELIDDNYPNELDAELELGEHGVLVRIAGWNGTADDPQVDVALADSPRGFADGAVLTGEELIAPPRWDATDEWLASDRAFAAGDIDRPIARDTTAYIVDDLIVAHPRDGTELRLTGNLTIIVPLVDATMTARFTGSHLGLEDGILTGRVPLDDVINTLPEIGYCPGTTEHTMFSTAADRAADLRINPTAPPSERCTAVSLAVGYTAVQANVRRIVPDQARYDHCDGVDDHACYETCGTARDGVCDDGGNLSRRTTCELGTDCMDCGLRRR